jgi:hypothetical protein
MPLTFLLDENQRGSLWQAIQDHNAHSAYPIDAVRVGDFPDLPLGSADPEIIRWAEREGRLIVSEDRATMRTFLALHLQAGGHCPGLLLLRPRAVLSQVVFSLALIAHAADPLVLQDSVEFIP